MLLLAGCPKSTKNNVEHIGCSAYFLGRKKGLLQQIPTKNRGGGGGLDCEPCEPCEPSALAVSAFSSQSPTFESIDALANSPMEGKKLKLVTKRECPLSLSRTRLR